MKEEKTAEFKNILELTEEECGRVKTQLINDGKIIEKTKISAYDHKFFLTVTTSTVLVKFFLFFSFFLYALINLSAIILSAAYGVFNLEKVLLQIFGCAFALFICFVIFRNLNSNKKKEREVIYINKDDFIFNFNNGIVKTPHLFYRLPSGSLQKIEFTVYGTRRKQIFGRVIFTFSVLNYRVTHVINSANLTEIENYFKSENPTLLEKLVKDGKSKSCGEKPKIVNAVLPSLGCAIVSVLFFVVPLALDYYNLSLIIAGCLFLLTAAIVLLSPVLYTYHLVQGLILSCIFIIAGYCIPLFVILNGQTPFLSYIASNSLILLPTFFGNIGLCIYVYIVVLEFNKIIYLIKRKAY